MRKREHSPERESINVKKITVAKKWSITSFIRSMFLSELLKQIEKEHSDSGCSCELTMGELVNIHMSGAVYEMKKNGPKKVLVLFDYRATNSEMSIQGFGVEEIEEARQNIRCPLHFKRYLEVNYSEFKRELSSYRRLSPTKEQEENFLDKRAERDLFGDALDRKIEEKVRKAREEVKEREEVKINKEYDGWCDGFTD